LITESGVGFVLKLLFAMKSKVLPWRKGAAHRAEGYV
jgi:hypothetical protein